MRKKIKERRGNRPSSVILEAAIIISFMILTIIVLLWKSGMSRNTFTCCYCTWNKSTEDRITLDPSRSELFCGLKDVWQVCKIKKEALILINSKYIYQEWYFTFRSLALISGSEYICFQTTKKKRLCGEPSDIDWRAAQDLSNKPVRNSSLESTKYKLSAKALFSELGFLRWHTLSTSLTEKVD